MIGAIAVASAILSKKPYKDAVLDIGRRYPHAGYGGSFIRWLLSDDPQPYAVISHNHPEGIKGAQATALAVFLARTGHDKEDIREQISRRFGYDLQRSVEGIRPGYGFRISCPHFSGG
jgi:hypothetical protein